MTPRRTGLVFERECMLLCLRVTSFDICRVLMWPWYDYLRICHLPVPLCITCLCSTDHIPITCIHLNCWCNAIREKGVVFTRAHSDNSRTQLGIHTQAWQRSLVGPGAGGPEVWDRPPSLSLRQRGGESRGDESRGASASFLWTQGIPSPPGTTEQLVKYAAQFKMRWQSFASVCVCVLKKGMTPYVSSLSLLCLYTCVHCVIVCHFEILFLLLLKYVSWHPH